MHIGPKSREVNEEAMWVPAKVIIEIEVRLNDGGMYKLVSVNVNVYGKDVWLVFNSESTITLRKASISQRKTSEC